MIPTHENRIFVACRFIMNRMKHTSRSRRLAISLAAGLCVVLSGCGGSVEQQDIDPLAVYEQFESGQQRHDPLSMVEVDLGDYLVTRRVADSHDILFVRFQLFAIVPRDDEQKFTTLIEGSRTRMRDGVLTIVQKADLKDLADARMSSVKSEVVVSINKSLRTRTVRDVVFSDFSLEGG